MNTNKTLTHNVSYKSREPTSGLFETRGVSSMLSGITISLNLVLSESG